VIFDLDGTLVDSVYQQVAAWQMAIAAEDLRVPAWQIHRVVGLGVREAAARLGLALTPPTARRLQAEHHRILLELSPGLLPCTGAQELLAALTSDGVPFAVVTGAGEAVAEVLLRHVPSMAGCPVVTADSGLPAKPAPDALMWALVKLGVAAPACWMIGDTPSDMEAARRAGGLAIGVQTGGWPVDDLHEAGAAHVVSDLRDLARWWRGEPMPLLP